MSELRLPSANASNEWKPSNLPQNPVTPPEAAPAQAEHKAADENSEKYTVFEHRYEELASALEAIKNDREITFQVSQLQSEGLQTLLTEYGTDVVFAAIKKELQSGAAGNKLSTFEVVKALEPDPKKKSSLV